MSFAAFNLHVGTNTNVQRQFKKYFLYMLGSRRNCMQNINVAKNTEYLPLEL